MSDNKEQRAHWNEVAGPVWVEYQERLDAQIRPFGELVLERLAPAQGERILDVGCGCGGTTLEIARRVGSAGEVVGVDLSGPMLARARERAAGEGLGHARFVEADAQTAALGGPFDAVFSRFGVMFFEDPTAAFGNLAGSLRPGGRMGFVCWQAPGLNPWIVVPMGAAAAFVEAPPPPPPDAAGMFQLADAEKLRGRLADAGLVEITIEDVRPELALGGGDLDEAADFFLDLGPLGSLLREQDPAGEKRDLVRAAVRDALAPHDRGAGPVLGSAVWVVGARRP